MFVPFVVQVIKSHTSDDFGLIEIKNELLTRHGLDVPAPALQTLLGRAVRSGIIRRSGGRYFRNVIHDNDDFSTKTSNVEREHAAVANNFIQFAKSKGISIANEEAALTLIVAFLEDHHISILIEPDPMTGVVAPETLPKRDAAIVARFLRDTFHQEPELTGYILRMLEGLVLRNALLLKDIALTKRKFFNLTIYFDTGFLLHALGLAGEPVKAVAREMLDLLKETQARLAVFEATIDEIKRILSFYQRHLGSPSGTLSLRMTDVTQHLLTHRYGPSDVAQVIALLEHDITNLGIRIVTFPERAPMFTYDEADLSRRLQRSDETDLQPRVMHDVNCTAAILTLRAGRTTDILENARTLFVTTSYSVVRTVVDWYRAFGGGSIPPVLHVRGLSNVAWLKKPTAAAQLKQLELIAICSTALRPSESTWNAFLRQLKKLQETGSLTSDESVAIVVQSLTDSSLLEMVEDSDGDAETIGHVIERVRSSYRGETARLVEEAKTATAEAMAGATLSEEKRRQLELRVHGKADRIAKFCSYALFTLVTPIVVGGLVLSLPGAFPDSARWLVLAIVALSITTVASIANLFWGVNLIAVRHATYLRLSKVLRNWLTEAE